MVPKPSSNRSSDVVEVAPHPFDKFRSSGDYEHFRAKVILPEIRRDRMRQDAFVANSLLRDPVKFKSSRRSLDSLYRTILDTEFIHPPHHRRLPYPTPEGNMSARIPLDICYPVVGNFSEKFPDCFVVTGGVFKVGSRAMLGRGGRVVRVLDVCVIGRDCFVMKVEDSGRLLEEEVPITRLVARYPPSLFRPSILQWLCMMFRRFLRTSFEDYGSSETSSVFGDV